MNISVMTRVIAGNTNSSFFETNIIPQINIGFITSFDMIQNIGMFENKRFNSSNQLSREGQDKNKADREETGTKKIFKTWNQIVQAINV